MTYADPQETMDSLIGRSFVEWGSDGTMYHVTLDDGRVLIFMALGILVADHAVH